jgi:hypothetical protein
METPFYLNRFSHADPQHDFPAKGDPAPVKSGAALLMNRTNRPPTSVTTAPTPEQSSKTEARRRVKIYYRPAALGHRTKGANRCNTLGAALTIAPAGKNRTFFTKLDLAVLPC